MSLETSGLLLWLLLLLLLLLFTTIGVGEVCTVTTGAGGGGGGVGGGGAWSGRQNALLQFANQPSQSHVSLTALTSTMCSRSHRWSLVGAAWSIRS